MSTVDVDQFLLEAVPRWTQADFLFLEPQPWWAPSVQTVLARTAARNTPSCPGRSVPWTDETTEYRCQSAPSTAGIYERILNSSVAGVVLMAEQRMRDCLLLLGRLSRLCRPCPPVLVIIPGNTVSLIPLLLESGAGGVLLQTVTDIQIADWCRRVTAWRALPARDGEMGSTVSRR